MQNLVPFLNNMNVTHRYAVYLYFTPDPNDPNANHVWNKNHQRLKWKKTYETCSAERAILHAKKMLCDEQYARVEIKRQAFYTDLKERREETYRIYQRNGKINVVDMMHDLRKRIANHSKR